MLNTKGLLAIKLVKCENEEMKNVRKKDIQY
jgi:hypothetical protein